MGKWYGTTRKNDNTNPSLREVRVADQVDEPNTRFCAPNHPPVSTSNGADDGDCARGTRLQMGYVRLTMFMSFYLSAGQQRPMVASEGVLGPEITCR